MTAPTLDVDPWTVREPRVDPATLPVAESLFSLSNGFLGIRGTLDEVEPCGMRGTYLSGVFETHPLSYPEEGYGQPEEGQALLTVADGTPLRLLVDGVRADGSVDRDTDAPPGGATGSITRHLPGSGARPTIG